MEEEVVETVEETSEPEVENTSKAVVKKSKKKKAAPKKKDSGPLTKLIIGLSVMFVVIPCMLIGLTYALFYDATHTEIYTRENYPNEEVFSDILTYSLNDTETTELMRVRITEDALNQVFHNVIYDSGSHFGDMNNFFVQITDTHYVFILEADLNGWFKTRVMLFTSLKIDDEKALFKISNLRIGRVNHFDNIPKLFFKVFKVPDINKLFHDHGFHMNFDLKNLAISYTFEDLATDLASAMGSGANEYATILKEMIVNRTFVDYLPNHEKAIEADLKLNKMRPTEELYNISGYVMPEGYLETPMADAIAKTKLYLEDSTIQPKDAQAVLNYYVQGYDHLPENYKTAVDPYLSSIAPASHAYNYVIPDSDNLETIIGQQLMSHTPLDTEVVIKLTTNQVDRALSGTDTIGNSLLFKAKSGDVPPVYTCNYVTFNRINCVVDSTTQSIFFTVSIDFNHYNIGLSLKATLESQEYGKAKLHLDNFYIGNEEVSEESVNQLVTMLTNMIGEGAVGDTISLVTEGEEIYAIFNIKDNLESAGFTEAAGFSTSFVVDPQTSSTPGTLRFVATKS